MDVAAWLKGLGLECFVPAFRDNDIDAEVLPKLTADDLIGLGVTSIGHRRKLFDAIATFGAERPATTATAAPHDVPPPADAERRQLTVMFCDLVGSTALASGLDPEDLREVLGAYHAAVAEVVAGFEGYVAKYMGDGVLAYFGYPRAHEHDAERAVRASLALVERVGRLESSAGVLASRVGIATGLVVVGDLIGSGASQERGVVGETPNLAARLQEMAPANAVLVAQSTRRLVGDLFDYHDLGAVAVKGLADPVPAWQVLSESTVDNRFEALRSASLSPLIGRDGEVELLLRRWVRAKDGEGQIVLVSGEAGIGKSRITAALQEQLESERPIRLRYSCSPHHRDSALHPFIVRLERAAGFSRGDAAAAKLDKLAALLMRSGETTPGTIGVFADLLGLPTEGRYPPPPPDPRQKRELILAAMVGQLEALARHRPVLFVFEDAHWIDSTSLELLERAAERVRRLPVLMVVTCRPEFESPWTGEAQVTALTLSRLGQRDTTTLVERLTGGNTLPAEILDRIVERTDGVPLFIEELTTTLLGSGLLREEDGHYVLAGPLPALAIPSSLHDSLMARLDQLAPVREMAQIGAAIGREFSYEVLTAVAHRTEEHVRSALDQLVAAGLVFRRGVPPQASFVFKHALVQDAAYGTLLRGRRQELHATIARVLEERVAIHPEQEGSAREHAALLVHHWLKAEEWEKALSYTLEAAKRAEKLYARPEAIGHYWQALDLLELLPPNVERGRIHIEVILSLSEQPGWMRDEAGKLMMFRHVDKALSDAVARGHVATIARLETIKAYYWEDEPLLLRAIERAESSGDAGAQAYAARWYGQYLGQRGKFEKALDHTARAIDLMGAQGRRLEQGFMMASQGRCYHARAGKLDQSLDYAAQARETGEVLNDTRLRAWCAMEAEPYLYQGKWDEVVRVVEGALPIAGEIREWNIVIHSSAWLAIAYLKLRLPADARQALERGLKGVPARSVGQYAYSIAFAQIALAQSHLAAGDTGEALIAAHRALGASEKGRFGLEEGAAHRVLGQIHEALDARAEADAAFRRSLGVWDEIQSRPELAQTLLAYGRFRRGGNTVENRALIERALHLFEEMNATGWIEEARAALAAA